MKTDKYVITKSGIKVYINYKDDICCEDKDNKALTDKAKIKREKKTEKKRENP